MTGTGLVLAEVVCIIHTMRRRFDLDPRVGEGRLGLETGPGFAPRVLFILGEAASSSCHDPERELGDLSLVAAIRKQAGL